MADTKTTLTWLLRDEVSGPARKAEGALGKLAEKGGKGSSLMDSLGGAIGGLVSPMGLAVGAAGALVGFLGESAKAAADEQKNIAKMGAALKSAVPGFTGNTDAIEKLIAKREDLGFSDDDLRDSMATLVTSTHDVSQAQDLQATAMDLARLKGVSLATASEALAKANVGSTKELKALGIAVDDTKDKQQVFTAIQKAAAGQAAAYANTSAGKWETFQHKMGDLMETIGDAVLPVFESLMDFMNGTVLPVLGDLANVVGPVLGAAFGIVGAAVGGFIDHVLKPAMAVIQGMLGFLHDVLKTLGVINDTPVPAAPQTGYAWSGDEKRAAGGPVEPGHVYTVGENGPEQLVMGSNSGRIIPNGAGMAGMVPAEIPIMLDGREVARVVDRHLYYALQGAAPTLLRT